VKRGIFGPIAIVEAALVVVFAAAAGFMFYQGSFITQQVNDELVSQKISFPAATEIKTGGALDPAVFPQEIRDLAGQQVDNGYRARIYAQDFIRIHEQKIANGETYSTMAGKIAAVNAQIAATPKTDPAYADLQKQLATMNGQRDTLFKGDMLRGALLNSYGWWTFGTYMVYGALAALAAAVLALGALTFEVLFAARKPKTVKIAQRATA